MTEKEPGEKLPWAIVGLLFAGVATVIGGFAGVFTRGPEGLATVVFFAVALLVTVPALLLGAIGALVGGRHARTVGIIAIVLAVVGPAGGCTLAERAIARPSPSPQL